MKIYLIRHGETEWNSDDRYQGCMDISLDETGVKQANLLGQRLQNYGIELIISSHLRRAAKTAEIIQGYVNCPLEIDQNLREIQLGEWEGKRWKDIQVEYADFLKKWHTDIVNLPMPGGESYADLKVRAVKAMEDLKNLEVKAVAIVTHGAVVKTMLSQGLQLGLEYRGNFEIDNASISEMRYERSKDRYKVIRMNDTAHLDGLGDMQ